MKLYLIIFLFSFITSYTTHLSAQDVGGRTLVSQSRTTSANIGKADITIKYHSPSVNGRKIFGGIVPFDFVVDGKEYPWRAGSNQRTTIEFSHDVKINGQALKAGSYGFVALVDKDEWILIFSSGKTWGAFNYDKENDVLRVPVKTQKVSFQEWLSYEFTNPTSESVDVQLRWEETAVSFNIATDALHNIISDLTAKEKKETRDYQELAIRTLEQNSNEHKKALDYLEQSYTLLDSIENEDYKQAFTFNYKVLKGELLRDMGNKKEGQKLIDEALENAKGFNIYYYALRKYTVQGKHKEAFKILSSQIEKHPDNYPNYLALGEYYLKEKNQEKATENFKKAYELTVEQNKIKAQNYYRYMYLQNKLVLERNSN